MKLKRSLGEIWNHVGKVWNGIIGYALKSIGIIVDCRCLPSSLLCSLPIKVVDITLLENPSPFIFTEPRRIWLGVDRIVNAGENRFSHETTTGQEWNDNQTHENQHS